MRERNPANRRIVLLLIDVAGFSAALYAAIWLRYFCDFSFLESSTAPWKQIGVAYPIVLFCWLISNLAGGAYRRRRSTIFEIGAVVRSTAFTFLLILAATFFYRGYSYSRGMIAFFIPLVVLFVGVGRLGVRALTVRALERFGGRARVLILGDNEVGRSLVAAMQRERDYFEVVGFLSTGEEADSAGGEQLCPKLGTISDLERLCGEYDFDSLVMVDRNLEETTVLECIEICLRQTISWNVVPGVHELLLDRAQVELVDGIPLVGMRGSRIVGFNWMIKRAMDVLGASLILLLASPLMVLASLAIKLSSPGPVFYVHDRVGFRGQVFPFIKFRSMHLNNDDTIHREYTKKWIEENAAHSEDSEGGELHKIEDDPRIFSAGKFIRRYSIDELPQLFNVLKGDMSLIGPRPALPYEVEVYREWHRRRFEAPPGITGLWQVSGRNRLSFEEMIKLDIDYLENWSVWMDIQILFRTIRVVLFEGAY